MFVLESAIFTFAFQLIPWLVTLLLCVNMQIYNNIMENFIFTGLLIFRAVADPRNSGISAKSREIPKKTRNTAKSARNISKYISAKHI